MELLAASLVVLIILVANELWWRKRDAHTELGRKFVHVTVGSFVAFWPLFLSWEQIELLSIAFLVGITVSKFLNIFQAIHSVQRPTWGEVYFALAVGAIALITHDKWIYVAALLQMSLADGLAAIVGSRFAGKYRYSVFGHAKSLVGTLTFFVVSMAILVLVNPHLLTPISLAWMLGISVAASFIENVGVNGSDNLLVPVLVALVLLHV
ncbi:MAG TPA: hypothetical protein VK534_01015 [Methylomirabilota bacterium]|nr:hypothetical protein [Methylomirabilota bacterium]